MNIIKVKNLIKEFKIPIKQKFIKQLLTPKFSIFTAVNNISLSIKKGESVALLGPNGAGKTTTIKMLTGILYPTNGEISVMGYVPQKRNKEMLRKIGFVLGSKSTLSKDLTAMQNYELNKSIYQISDNGFQNKINELARILDVSEHLDKRVRSLSLGQRMKAELINSILHNPEILYLDEPTIGLDITSQNNIRSFLRRINKEFGTTILLTSHNMEDIEQVIDRVLIINKGELTYDNSLETLKRSFSNKKYLKVIFKNNVAKETVSQLKSYGTILNEENDFIRLEIEKDRQSEILQKILSLPNVHDIDLEGIPLSKIIETSFKNGK